MPFGILYLNERKEKEMSFRGKIIDLTQEIYQGMPVYPGHLKTVVWTHLSHEECQRQLGTGFSYETRGIMFCDHGPTHIDSVSHLSRDPKAPSVDKIPLEHCITSAIGLDVSDIPQKTQFGREKIERLQSLSLTRDVSISASTPPAPTCGMTKPIPAILCVLSAR
jgi:kynurenine formamidase